MDPETSKKIQELQVLEQALNNSLSQRQNIQLELNEVENALNELKISDEEVYRVLSGIMLKSNKQVLTDELNTKKKMLEMKIQALEKHENMLENNLKKLRDDVTSIINSSKK